MYRSSPSPKSNVLPLSNHQALSMSQWDGSQCFVLYQVIDVNLNFQKGVLFTAEAADRQIVHFDNGGSIVLTATRASVCSVGASLLRYHRSSGIRTALAIALFFDHS